MYSKY